MARSGPLSMWHDTLEPDDPGTPRPPLGGDLDADVAIVGAGFAGLWTAYHLLSADPTVGVVVLERDTAGFGASGRNGGWCVGDQGGPLPALEKEAGRDAAVAMVRAVQSSVDEIGATAAAEGIDCGYAKGGALYLSSNAAQHARHSRIVAHYHHYGFDDSYQMLTPREVVERINATGIHGAMWTPHCAALHPARLARGVARAVERLGGTVYEQTAVRSIERGRAVTERGTVRAEIVVRATEAYTASLAGREREIVPVHNYMVATEPLGDDVWDEVGLRHREVFEDSPYMVGYGQRTADGRIAWGGLGAGYSFGSRVPASPMKAKAIAARLEARLVAMFPVLRGVRITHHWGGVLGMHRDRRPSVVLDRAEGIGWAGGFGGSGVASSHTAARSLADLILDRDTDHARLPWVGHRSRDWEPEPMRFLGVRSGLLMARVADMRDALRD
jgi:glycine/D-amino acid oxidase-like deaminating enzyme